MNTESLNRRYEKKKATPRGLIGGDFEAMGCILFDLVCVCGMRPGHSVVELDCGRGRLTVHLSQYLKASYLGIDSDPQALAYTRELTGNRSDWRFEPPSGFRIAAPDATIDTVCCFGPLTRLLHEESYLYLEEIERVLKPGGKVILSFLEFEVPNHWAVFEQMVARRRGASAAAFSNQFVSRDALYAWAGAAGLTISDLWGGDSLFIYP